MDKGKSINHLPSNFGNSFRKLMDRAGRGRGYNFYSRRGVPGGGWLLLVDAVTPEVDGLWWRDCQLPISRVRESEFRQLSGRQIFSLFSISTYHILTVSKSHPTYNFKTKTQRSVSDIITGSYRRSPDLSLSLSPPRRSLSVLFLDAASRPPDGSCSLSPSQLLLVLSVNRLGVAAGAFSARMEIRFWPVWRMENWTYNMKNPENQAV
ncbi:transcriptional regulator [Striga asiatica]|uniref:Transcriptional regulator n=1 Tax=Striga asiatica TaxID=4170 RepID=A0A5A7R3G2_STRAF|nr:transcriptional regulator [Striga asiatica]